MTMLTVLLTVIGIVNVWVQYRMLRQDILVHSYNIKEMLWLYFRCWIVLICGITLAVVFYWFYDLLPESIQPLIHNLYILFYCICAFLTIAALLSVILSEDLNEIKFLNAQNENQLLKAQLNPHFLYNTLNNIDALVWIDQEKASEAVTTLSDLMRYLTYSSKQTQISVFEEVSHLQQLIALQKLRIRNENSLKFSVDIDDQKAMVAPLMMIPIVENCFKHVGTLEEDGSIIINVSLKENCLRLYTNNNTTAVTETSDKKNSGVGLAVLRRRLSILYSNRFTLLTESKNGRFFTELTINL